MRVNTWAKLTRFAAERLRGEQVKLCSVGETLLAAYLDGRTVRLCLDASGVPVVSPAEERLPPVQWARPDRRRERAYHNEIHI